MNWISRAQNAKLRPDIPEEWKRLAAEAMLEIEKRLKDDPAFIQKLGTSFSMAVTDLITEDVGIVLNSCRINPLLTALTSDKRGAIIVYQPFPLVYCISISCIRKNIILYVYKYVWICWCIRIYAS